MLNYILEAGHMAPSSFGLEPWKFLVVSSTEMKEKLKSASYEQAQVATASSVIVILAKKNLYISESYASQTLIERVGTEVYDNFYKDFYTGYTQDMSREQLTDWADKQCHLAAMNMMNASAAIEIDTCPIGGFIASQVQEILNIDPDEFAVSMLIPVGYREKDANPKVRHSFDKVVEFID